VFRGRMSEDKSFQWEVSMKLSTLNENVSFSTCRPQHTSTAISDMKTLSKVLQI